MMTSVMTVMDCIKGNEPEKIMMTVTDQDPLSNGSEGLMRLENDAAP